MQKGLLGGLKEGEWLYYIFHQVLRGRWLKEHSVKRHGGGLLEGEAYTSQYGMSGVLILALTGAVCSEDYRNIFILCLWLSCGLRLYKLA